MNNNSKISPNQLKAIAEHFLKSYYQAYLDNQLDSPRYETIVVDGGRFKIGVLPGAEGSATVMNIKIVRKGNI